MAKWSQGLNNFFLEFGMTWYVMVTDLLKKKPILRWKKLRLEIKISLANHQWLIIKDSVKFWVAWENESLHKTKLLAFTIQIVC